MRKRIILLTLMIFVLSHLQYPGGGKVWPVLKGPYLGQKPPGMNPEVFAPGLISTNKYKEFSCTFSPDGKDFYFNRGGNIMVCRLRGGVWEPPKPASFNTENMDHEPHITADGTKLFFGSNRPQPGNSAKKHYGIWVIERTNGEWRKPNYAGSGMYVTAARNGNIYLTDFSLKGGGLSKTRFVGGSFSEPEKLLGDANSEYSDAHPCIALDESYLLFDSNRPGSHQGEGTNDLYVCFKNQAGSWGKAINIGEKLKLKAENICAYISPDGKYLFYNSSYKGSWDIYWVDARIIHQLNPKTIH